MNASRQLINLLGIVVTAAVGAAGILLIDMPMYSQAQTIDSNTRSVAQTNAVYEAQIAQLSAADDRIDEIEADLARLRTQIAATPQLDDVHEIVAAAAETVDVRLESTSVDDPQAWIARDVVDADGDAIAVETPTPGGTTTNDDASTSDDATASPTPRATPSDSTTNDSTTAATQTAQQVLVTITVDVTLPYDLEDGGDASTSSASRRSTSGSSSDGDAIDTERLKEQADKAVAFVDRLGAGPRLISPIDVTYSEDGTLVVTALTFIRAED